jgi:hypothetical protein
MKVVCGTVASKILHDTMNGLEDCLVFTIETGSDFVDGWLPTLDTSMKVSDRNLILYRFFEKPVSSNTTLLPNTALGENLKIKSLGNDMIRRMLNTSELVDMETRCKVVDSFATKLITSGYNLEKIRQIIISGLKGYEKQLKISRQPGGRPLHQNSGQSKAKRQRNKLLGKSEWFRKERKDDCQEDDLEDCATQSQRWSQDNMGERRQDDSLGGLETGCTEDSSGKKVQETLRTTSVLFVEQTRGGSLARSLKLVESRLSTMMGFHFRVVEKAGSKLQQLLSNSNLWAGMNCGRSDCTTCRQGGEDLPDCKARSLMYESKCRLCNPPTDGRADAKKSTTEEERIADRRAEPSIYIGETSRSIYERSKEHMKDAQGMHCDSHMMKHWVTTHKAEGQPEFRMEVVRKYRDSLSRQIGEAVRIQMRGCTLNSKMEYNRSSLTRLVIDDEWERKLRERREEEEKETIRRMKHLEELGEEEIAQQRQMGEKRQRQQEEQTDRPKKRARKLKYRIPEETTPM